MKSTLTELFDAIDSIDRSIYGKRMKLFLWGCLLVLIIAPILDVLLGNQNDALTFYSTLIFFLFLFILLLALIGSWRDDTGNWSLPRAKSRFFTYYETLNDSFKNSQKLTQDQNLFNLGQFLILSGISWKALSNISLFIRRPLQEMLGTRFTSWRNFELITNHYYWVLPFIGISIILYLYRKDKQILNMIEIRLRHLFGWKNTGNTKYGRETVKIDIRSINQYVINTNTEHQINIIKSTSNSTLFNEFVGALQNWNPKGAYYEYEYQDKLYRHLRKYLPDAIIELEYPIGETSLGNKGRADIVINDTILIEMKRDSSAGAIQRAKGQIQQYSEIWSSRGPIILLLCDYEYEHAKLAFSQTMADLATLNRNALTIVAKPK